MKNVLLLCLCCALVANINAQISTINVAIQQEQNTINKNIYDPILNYPLDLNSVEIRYNLLIEEELYVLPLASKDEIYNQAFERGYKGFKTAKFNVKKDKEYSKRYGIPAPGDKTRTNAEDLQNKIFIVKSVDHSNDQYPLYCLSLMEKDNPNNVCKYVFQYLYDFNTTFVTMKHYAYLKEQCVGKKYYFDESCLPKYDSKTGEPLINRSWHYWECKDIIISPVSGKLTMLLSYNEEETFLYEYAGTMHHSSDKSILEEVALGGKRALISDLFI